MYFKDTVIRIADAAKRRVRSFLRKLFRALPFVFAGLALLCIVISAIQITRLKEFQYDQYAAERWAGDSGNPYRQVSVIGRGQLQSSGSAALFIDSGVSLNKETITELRNTISGIITTAESQKKDNDPDAPQKSSGRAWVDAYYAEAKSIIRVTVDGQETGVSTESRITGVSGYYYLFHPRQILSGSFLAEVPIDGQTIVLNEQLAWLLFKSNDIQDQTVMIGMREYTIIGVVREPDRNADRTAGFDEPRAYMYFDELALMNQPVGEPKESFENQEAGSYYSSGEGEIGPGDLAIFCYEAVLSDPIDGIALNDLKTALTTYNPSEGNFYFVNHTDRFGLLRIADRFLTAGEDVPQRSTFTFPASELSAQITEQYLSIAWIILFVAVFFLIISLLASFLTIRRRLSRLRPYEPKKDASEDDNPRQIEMDDSFLSIRRV